MPNLPETRSGRWGQGLTPEKMADCVWLMPVLVGQFEFLEWTPDDHLRHSRFVGLRKDKTRRRCGSGLRPGGLTFYGQSRCRRLQALVDHFRIADDPASSQPG
jgi:hypothetical protein